MSSNNTLTKEQEIAVDAYGIEMVKNGIKCGKFVDKAKAKTIVARWYKEYVESPNPPEVVFVDSPEAALKKAAKLTGMERKDLVNQIIWANLWSWWVAYYHAGINILGETEGVEPELIAELNTYEKEIKELHAILPLENTCFVIEYPKTVAIRDNDLDKFVLHRENGRALEYNDGTGFAWLNNTEVPDWVATTRAKKLSVKKIMAETNVDVRREGLRRVPIDKFLKETKSKLLDKVKDVKRKWNNYELYDANFGDGKVRRLLRMFDVASKAWCVERVEDSCKTVAEALAWRDDEDSHIKPSTRT